MRPYYKEYFGEDRATDVISFPMETLTVGEALQAEHLGSIAISLETAKRQAKEHRHSLWEELRLLIIHGLLHLLGHDHAEPEESERMKAQEQHLLAVTKDV